MRQLTALLALLLCPALASAQPMTDSDRAAAMNHVSALSQCLTRSHQEMDRFMVLIRQAERQRDVARDAAARRDADRAIEALIGRVADLQGRTRACVSAPNIPSSNTRVIVREAPPDPAAASVAGSEGSIQSVEQGAELSSNIHVVRGWQIDGQGELDDGAVRSAMRGIASRLERCYDQYLEDGSIRARQLDLVFTFRAGAGRATSVEVEQPQFDDQRFLRCVRSAGQRLRASTGPSGGDATYDYRLRFGRAEH